MGKEKINRGITWQDDIIVEALWKNKITWTKIKMDQANRKIHTRGAAAEGRLSHLFCVCGQRPPSLQVVSVLFCFTLLKCYLCSFIMISLLSLAVFVTIIVWLFPFDLLYCFVVFYYFQKMKRLGFSRHGARKRCCLEKSGPTGQSGSSLRFLMFDLQLARNGCLRTTVLHLINCKHHCPAQRRIPNDFCN